MNNNIFDCVIIGGGVIGCSIARYLSRFKVDGILLERHKDVGDEVSSANSGIVHSGYDPKENTLKAKFNVLGNKMMGDVSKELDVPFIRNGSLTIGFNEEDLETLKKLLIRSKNNGVDARIVEYDELHLMEPNLSENCKYALYCKDSGIVSPFRLTIKLMENAMDNGFKLGLEEEVISIKKENNIYKVITNKNEYLSKAVINAAGLDSDKVASFIETPKFTITPRKGEYILLDHFNNDWCKHTLFMCPTKYGKGVLISPTTSFNYLIGPSNTESEKEDTSTDRLTLDKVKKEASKLIKNIPYDETIRTFAGVRPNTVIDDFLIYESETSPLFFVVGGIMSPGLASSLAIGEYVSNLVKDKLNLEVNPNFNPKVRKAFKLANLGEDKYNELIKEDKRYGHMICRCEKVTEGEIVDAIHRNSGATTLKGIKKRCRCGFGKCQMTFCEGEIIKILARELNKDVKDISYRDKGSEVMKYTFKGEE